MDLNSSGLMKRKYPPPPPPPGMQFNRHLEFWVQIWGKLSDTFSTRSLQVLSCPPTPNMSWDSFWDENKCLLNCTLAGHPGAHPVPPLPPPPPPPPLPPHHHHHPPTVHQHHGMHGFNHADFLHSAAAVAAASEAGGGGASMDRNGLDGESPTLKMLHNCTR